MYILINVVRFTTDTDNIFLLRVDTSGNYRYGTSHDKKNNFIWYNDTLMKNMLNFENELI